MGFFLGFRDERKMADDLKSDILENAAGPRKASGDSGSVEQHSLKEQIEADRYLAGKGALAGKNFGLTKVKIVPPGAV